MADQDHLLTRLQALLATLDDQAFEALASKGLVRRAQKDLEKTKPEILPGTPDGLPIKVEGFIVTLPETGPGKASCTCPASGVCQHILTASLFLKQASAAAPSLAASCTPEFATSAGEEIMKLSLKELEKWAGRPALKAGFALVANSPQITIKQQGSVVIRFPTLNAECRFLPGGGLDGMIISSPGKDVRKYAVAAVLLFQKANGAVLPEEQTASVTLADAAGAPRSREEVLRACRQLLEELVSIGIAHVSEALEQRFATLSLSALGVNLPRLALALRGLSDEISLLVSRNAQGDKGRVFLLAAHTFALCCALEKAGQSARPDLVGWHRTQYEEAGTLELCGLGAYRWRTASGYAGLTVLFWDEKAQMWNSWSDARPTQFSSGFDPAARYHQDGPWLGATSLARISKSQCRLMHAKRSQALRLSSSKNSRILILGETPVLDFGEKVFSDWTALLDYSRAMAPGGLRESKPLQDVVVVRPAEFLDRHFDPVRQSFTWVLADSQHHLLPIMIRFDDLHEPIIRRLERWDPLSETTAGIVVRIFRQAGQLTLFPISLLKEKKGKFEVVNLGLDSVAEPAQQPQSAPSTQADEEPDEQIDIRGEEESEHFITNHDLVELEEELFILAEAGTLATCSLESRLFEQLRSRLENSGLRILAEKTRALAAKPGAALLLQLRYLCHLHEQAATAS